MVARQRQRSPCKRGLHGEIVKYPCKSIAPCLHGGNPDPPCRPNLDGEWHFRRWLLLNHLFYMVILGV